MPKICNKKIDPKRFNKRVAIQAVTETADGQGGFTDVWATSVTVWASVKPVRAYERFQSMQLETPVTHNVTMRYQDSITTKNRLLYDGRILHVESVINEEEADLFLTLKCKEIES